MGDLKMTVNVSLCGSVPRSQMICNGIRPNGDTFAKENSLPFLSSGKDSKFARQLQSKVGPPMKKPRRVSNDYMPNLPPAQIAPPQWAVPARGEARLEPICSGLYNHSPVDLNAKSCIRFGRSQSSDVQLLHDTSSRRHAIIFHHPNGSCYVIDCGSAHGTYVNGVRVNTPVINTAMNLDSPHTGAVIPHRVKKGSLIRFGGVGAPSYILKSFSVGLASLVKDLEIAEVFTCTSNIIEDEPVVSSQFSLASYDSSKNISAASLLTVNTRLNAMGKTSMQSASRRCLPELARARLGVQPIFNGLNTPFLKKRSLSSFVPRCVSDDNPIHKKRRASVFEDNHVLPLSIDNLTDVALISPSRSKQSFTIDISESDRPVVSPNPSNDNDNLVLDGNVKSIMIVPLSLSLAKKEKKCVKFSVCPPQIFTI